MRCHRFVVRMSRNVTVAAIVQLRRREIVNAAPTARYRIASAPLFVVGAGGHMTVLVMLKPPYTKKHTKNDIAFGFVDNIKASIQPNHNAAPTDMVGRRR